MAHHQHEPGRADPSAAHALYPAAAFVHSVPFSPDGRVVISGSGDKIIRIWNSAHADKARAGVDTDGPRGADEDDPYPESDTPSIRASAFSNDPSIKKRKKKKKRKNGRGALADAEDEDDLPPVPISALTPEPEPASRFASMSPPPWPQPVRLLRTMEREFSEMDMTAADQLLLVVSKNPLWGDVPGHRIGEDEKFGQSRHKPSRIYAQAMYADISQQMVQLFTGTTLRSPPLDPAVFTLALSEPYLAQLSQRYREAANAPCSSKELTQNIIDALDEALELMQSTSAIYREGFQLFQSCFQKLRRRGVSLDYPLAEILKVQTTESGHLFVRGYYEIAWLDWVSQQSDYAFNAIASGTTMLQRFIIALNTVAFEEARASDSLYSRGVQRLRRWCRESGSLPSFCTLADAVELETPACPLSSSGLSDVYRGHSSGTLVAVKALRVHVDDQEATQKSFRNEVVTWMCLRHPNIVPFLGISDCFPVCIVSAWMPGGTISSFFVAYPDKSRSLHIQQIVCGLEFMHEYGVVHGDLKPANILIDEDQNARLADFGMATVLCNTSSHLTSATGEPVGGTIRFMAPELLAPGSEGTKLTVQSDIYALAITLWELFSQEVPYSYIRNDPAVLLKVLAGERPTRPSASAVIGFTDEVWDVMQRGWAQNPEHRPRLVEVRRVLAPDTQDLLVVEKRLLKHEASICASFMNDAVLRIHSVMDRRAKAVRSAMPGAGYTEIGSTHVEGVEWRRQSALDVARTQIAEAEEAVRRLEDELRRAESAAATQQSEMARREEEAARREEEATRREEEATRKEEEATRREAELARREAEMVQELANLRREKQEARLQMKQARRQDEAARVEVEDS